MQNLKAMELINEDIHFFVNMIGISQEQLKLKEESSDDDEKLDKRI